MKSIFTQIKSTRFPVLIILFSVLNSQLLSCSSQEDSLDQVKSFKPEDKYFKSSLVSLHFVMETSPIPEVDTFFNQLIQLHDLPISAEGAKDGTFIGESPYDAFDYKHVVKINIKDHKITEVDYNEVKKGGMGKQEDGTEFLVENDQWIRDNPNEEKTSSSILAALPTHPKISVSPVC